MKRVFLAISVMMLALTGCSSDPNGGGGTGGTGGTGGCAQTCTAKNQCGLGEICSNECCVPWERCEPGGCAAGEFCDPATLDCVAVTTACSTSGCECFIVGTDGNIPASGSPTIEMAPNASFDVDVVVALLPAGGGTTLPGAATTLTLESDTNSAFAISTSGTAVESVAGVAAGSTATVRATVDNLVPAVSCTAALVNRGDATNGQIRFHVFDDTTGAAIAGATVIVDASGSGTDEAGVAAVASTPGFYETTTAPTTAYDLTVFANNYNYLTLVGVDSAITDVAVPLSPRFADPMVGGFTGAASFAKYEQNYLDGQKKTIQAAIVGASFPLKALLNFDLSMFLGEMPTGDCADANVKCYDLDFGSVGSFTAPLPGGVVIALSNTTGGKESFDASGLPGRRYAWALGGEVDISDLTGLINIVMPYFSDCTCNVSASCDPDLTDPTADCACDTDCPLKLDFAEIINSIVPLLGKFASGVQANLPLEPATETDWHAFLDSADYQVRDPDAQGRFPKLDTGFDYPKLEVANLLENFDNIKVPALPQDPYAPNPNGGFYDMEGMIVLTGRDAVGQGFVPLGAGLAVDCTAAEGKCLDRDNNQNEFDSKVNAAIMCKYDADPFKNECPPNVPEQVNDEHIGLFHAPAHSGLNAGEPATALIALPMSALLEDFNALRLSAAVVREAPENLGTAENTQFATASFTAVPHYEPASATATAGRVDTWQVDGTGGYEASWLTFATNPDTQGQTARWNVYFGPTGGTFTPPTVPDLDGDSTPEADPMLAAVSGGDITVDNVNVTRIGFDMSGRTLSQLISNNGDSISDIIDFLTGFGVVSGDVCVPGTTTCP